MTNQELTVRLPPTIIVRLAGQVMSHDEVPNKVLLWLALGEDVDQQQQTSQRKTRNSDGQIC